MLAMNTIPLNRANLQYIMPPVRTPKYDVAGVKPGIVHLGLGGFHRAHMARYTHDLMEQRPDALGWGIIGAGLLPADRRMQDSLGPQDNLYTLVERSGAAGNRRGDRLARRRDLRRRTHSAALLDAIDDPAIRIVSLTVTENGYCLNPRDQAAGPGAPADPPGPARSRSAQPAPSASSSRPIGGDGGRTTAFHRAELRQHPAQRQRCCGTRCWPLPRLRDPTLADWIESNGRFPSTMVDRITPVTTAEDIAVLRERYGIIDHWPVVCETFTQWVIEDRFPAGRPAWEDVGAQFVTDVAPYEFMKLRLLNASHLAVAGLGRLAGLTYIDEAMADPLLRRYMAALMDRETGPTLPALPDIDLAAYKAHVGRALRQPRHQGHGGAGQHRCAAERAGGPDPRPAARPARVIDFAGAGAGGLAAPDARRGRAGPADRHPPSAGRRAARARPSRAGPIPRPLLGIEPLFGDTGHATRVWLQPTGAAGSACFMQQAACKRCAEPQTELGF